jgi:hypothetical protein
MKGNKMNCEPTPVDLFVMAIIGAFIFAMLGFLAYGFVMYNPIEMDYTGNPAHYELMKNGG